MLQPHSILLSSQDVPFRVRLVLCLRREGSRTFPLVSNNPIKGNVNRVLLQVTARVLMVRLKLHSNVAPS